MFPGYSGGKRRRAKHLVDQGLTSDRIEMAALFAPSTLIESRV